MFEENTISIVSKGVSPLGQFDAAAGFICVMWDCLLDWSLAWPMAIGPALMLVNDNLSSYMYQKLLQKKVI